MGHGKKGGWLKRESPKRNRTYGVNPLGERGAIELNGEDQHVNVFFGPHFGFRHIYVMSRKTRGRHRKTVNIVVWSFGDLKDLPDTWLSNIILHGDLTSQAT